MFLERKFSRPGLPGALADPPLCPVLPGHDWSRLPESLPDVVTNVQLLLAARRGYSHLLADFGLSPANGQHGLEARIERLQAELPSLLQRYESRFRLEELDVEVDDAGVACMKVTGQLLTSPGTLVFHFGIVNRKLVAVSYEPGELAAVPPPAQSLSR